MKASTIVEIPSRLDLSVLVQFGNNAATRTSPTADNLDGIFRFEPHHGHRASNAVYVGDEHTELCGRIFLRVLIGFMDIQKLFRALRERPFGCALRIGVAHSRSSEIAAAIT